MIVLAACLVVMVSNIAYTAMRIQSRRRDALSDAREARHASYESSR